MADTNEEFVPDEDFAEVDVSESLQEDEAATEEEYDTEDEAPAEVGQGKRSSGVQIARVPSATPACRLQPPATVLGAVFCICNWHRGFEGAGGR